MGKGDRVRALDWLLAYLFFVAWMLAIVHYLAQQEKEATGDRGEEE